MARRVLFLVEEENNMANETRENRNIEGEGKFEGARKYDPRASEISPSAEVEGEGLEAAGPGVEGEGSYEAAREYDRRLGEFVRSGRVAQAANDAEAALDRDPVGHGQAERKGKAKAKPDPEVEALVADYAPGVGAEVAVHVKHERHGWVVEPGKSKGPAPIFDSMDDALRRAHEIAAEQHLPLLVHGPDGELIDKYDAL
jgi:hypothetical protein